MKKTLYGGLFTVLLANFTLVNSTNLYAHNTSGYHPAEDGVTAAAQWYEAMRKLTKKIERLEDQGKKLEDDDGILLGFHELREELSKYDPKNISLTYDYWKKVQSKIQKKEEKGQKIETHSKLKELHQINEQIHSFTFGLNGLLSKTLISKEAQAPVKDIVELPNLKYYPSEMIYDQGNLGSCTANSLAWIIRYLTVQNSKKPTDFVNNIERLDISRLYQYWVTRAEEAKLTGRKWEEASTEDLGASMAGAIVACDKYGVTPENIVATFETIDTPDFQGKDVFKGWPYNDDNVTFTKYPDPECFRLAYDSDFDGLNVGTSFTSQDTKRNIYPQIGKSIQYKDVTTPWRDRSNPKKETTPLQREGFRNQIVAALKKGMPFYVGVMLDDSFMQDQRGFIPTPNLKTFQPTGGHAIVIVGYGKYNSQNPQQNYYKFVNSWTSSWGDEGYGYFEDNYIENLNIFAIEGFNVWLPLMK